MSDSNVISRRVTLKLGRVASGLAPAQNLPTLQSENQLAQDPMECSDPGG